MPRVLKPPCTQDEWRKIAAEFHAIWNFPMCIGALDGKHVMIPGTIPRWIRVLQLQRFSQHSSVSTMRRAVLLHYGRHW